MFWAKIAARSAIGTNPSSFLHFVNLAANQFWKRTIKIRKEILINGGRELKKPSARRFIRPYAV
jgi:hypothetical protein